MFLKTRGSALSTPSTSFQMVTFLAFRQYAKILKEGNGWDSQGAVYRIGYSIVEFIQQSYGSDGLITLIQTNGDISKVTDKPLEQVFDEWIEFTENKYY